MKHNKRRHLNMERIDLQMFIGGIVKMYFGLSKNQVRFLIKESLKNLWHLACLYVVSLLSSFG